MQKISVSEAAASVIKEVEKIIVGKSQQIRLLVMAILAEGHILLEDIPGVGKTTLVKTLSHVLGCDYKRIQFTPDLLPSDIIGVNTYNQKRSEFQFVPGPVMTQILLADEINRAIPRTQAALLEAMEEKQVTNDGVTYDLPKPFVVMATQNPIESEGTFLLPAAQMDRFIVKISLGYPSHSEEGQMLNNLGDRIPFGNIQSILSSEIITQLQQQIYEVYIAQDVVDYIVALVQQTRRHPMVKIGASPRASRALYKAGKVWAAMHQRDFVTPDDIKELVIPILNHRLLLNTEARLSNKTVEGIISEIISSIPVPPRKEAMFNGR
ncbi:MoxR family ATPase [Petroclostridium sp. X23]|uniref:AAA family ATPase n=1 Tax=Petroclostridium sp. X23 TaxID=3045146 RepID=UPI0024AE0881|nr:MoxR family ATPase [Petroclostridium sp. X23]WHH61552.1 MoxR family ATPase [Petroclostridium sp. X23]